MKVESESDMSSAKQSVPFVTLVVIVVLLFFTGLLGYNYFAQPLKNWTPPWVTAPQATPVPAAEQQDDELLTLINSLTPRQKLAQLLAAPVVIGTDITADPSQTVSGVPINDLEALLALEPGWVTFFGNDVSFQEAETLAATISGAVTTTGLAPSISVDHEGGTVQRLSGEGFTALPSWQELCGMPDAQRRALLKQSATELYNAGIHVVLAPMADFGGSNSVLKNRICSDNPEVVIERVSEFRAAFDNQGLGAVVKHFPGIGTTKRDLHTSFDQVEVSSQAAEVYRRLLLTEQPPNLELPQSAPEFFPVTLLAPAPAVMVTHVGVTNQYASIPCSLSVDCVGELRALLPSVVIFSDALEMKAAAYDPAGLAKDLPVIAEQAITAGNDVLVFGPSISRANLDTILVHLESRYQNNPVLRSKVDAALYRTLAYRRWLVANSKQQN